jgi:hypothetical protein
MSTLFVSTAKPPSLEETGDIRIDPEEYARAMKRRWPDGNIGHVTIGSYILHWELNRGNELGILGGLQENRLVVSFGSAPMNNAIEFIIWHRNFVPAKQKLFLFDESLETIIELKSDLTSKMLEAALE